MRGLICILSGVLVFDKTTKFNHRVEILDGTKIILQNGSSLIFENSVVIQGGEKPISITSPDGGS